MIGRCQARSASCVQPCYTVIEIHMSHPKYVNLVISARYDAGTQILTLIANLCISLKQRDGDENKKHASLRMNEVNQCGKYKLSGYLRGGNETLFKVDSSPYRRKVDRCERPAQGGC